MSSLSAEYSRTSAYYIGVEFPSTIYKQKHLRREFEKWNQHVNGGGGQ